MKRICGIPRTEFPIQHTAPLMTLVWGRDCLQAGVLLVMTVAVCAGAVGLNAPHVVGLGPAGTHAEAASDVSDSPSTRRVVPLPESLRAAKLLQNVAIADFNGDGIADLAIADFVSDSVLILIGDETGHFRLVTRLVSSGGPRAIVAADFNHDRVMDLAVANFFSGDVNIFRGRGDGSFDDPQSIHLAQGVSALTTADTNSDGDLALVAANFLSGALTVLKQQPDGLFAVKATMGPIPAVSLLYSEDFNGNGRQDLIAVDASENRAWLFAGNGQDVFQQGKSIDPQIAASLLGIQAKKSGMPAPASQSFWITKTAGDGQLAYPGSALPSDVVATVTSRSGGVITLAGC